MKMLGKWMLGAVMAVGALGFGANTAHAARIGVYMGAPVAYVPPCPGPGYAWVAGYYNPYNVWVPGYWNLVGPRAVVGYGGPVVVVGRHSDRGFYRGGWRR